MKKTFKFIISFIILFCVAALFMPVLTRAESNTQSAQELIAVLQEQIEKLKAQIAELTIQLESLRQAKGEIKETKKEVKTTLKLIGQMRRGMSGNDVKLLQEILATDPEIYPEELITGYFGPLTEKAVKKFQEKANIEQVGIVGPKTLSKINELLEEGAGTSGKVPPGLLIAPGIRQKLGGVELKPLPGQVLPPGIEKKVETTTPAVEGVNPILF